ncbi:hypothetical protein OV079_33910 [Nannocystis pusilla]|uniref:Uncharacterized protein n=1 Tax=Nannocystis pusilla TaxID=889268 RepID=A0A9X3EUN5_9BACT|nr:hypothetical protein [Nannocystis pusilla]MCY1010477.1 hypothetical protein [Nannocystis pusilla]
MTVRRGDPLPFELDGLSPEDDGLSYATGIIVHIPGAMYRQL